MRINKYLAECGVASRRKADEIIAEGRVSVNKKVVKELGLEVDEEKDVVYLDGKKIVRVLRYDYVMFNKPKGCVTTASDDKGRKTVFDFVDSKKRLFPVGRLDWDSEGLLLLTNDGDLTFKLTHPSSEIPKTYVVKIEGEIQESDLAALRKGVTVEGVKYGKCKVKVTGIEDKPDSADNMKLTRLEVVVTEGKNREIRKMFTAVEKNVVFLKRVAIGDLRLGGLSRGGSRELNDAEIEYLKKL
jgi:pseudouridine synthase